MSEISPVAPNDKMAAISNLIADSAAGATKPNIKPSNTSGDPDPDDDTSEVDGSLTDAHSALEEGDNDGSDDGIDTTDTDNTDNGDSDAGDDNSDEDASDDGDADGDGGDGSGDVDTLNNLAEELDTPIGDMYALGVKMAAGEDQTIGSLKDFYEQNHNIEEARQNIADKEVELNTQAEMIGSIPQVSDELIQARATVIAITQNYERVNWEQVRENSPGEYAALQQDFQTAFSQAQAAEKEIAGKVDDIVNSTDGMQQAKLYQKVPKLKDDAYRNKAASNVLAFATKYGFSAKEVEDINDSRLMHMLIDASSGAMVVDSAAEKQVAKELPKNTKATRKTPNHESASRRAKLKRLTDKARASTNMHEKTDAISAIIAQG